MQYSLNRAHSITNDDSKDTLNPKNQNVRMYGYVFQDKNGRNDGIILKILLFLLNENFTDSCGKDSSKKHQKNVVGKKYQIGNAYSFIKNKSYSSWSMWMTLKWPERTRI